MLFYLRTELSLTLSSSIVPQRAANPPKNTLFMWDSVQSFTCLPHSKLFQPAKRRSQGENVPCFVPLMYYYYHSYTVTESLQSQNKVG